MSGASAAVAEDPREALRSRLVAAIPPSYSPWLHLAFPSAVALGVIALAAVMVRDLRAWQLLMIPAHWVLSNAAEWRAHKYLLHRRTRPLEVLYDRHTPEHHRVYVEADMAIRSAREFRLVLIPAYGILTIAVASMPLWGALALAGQWNLAWLALATSVGYSVSYEWLHLAYHLPETSLVGRFGLVRRLRRHHAVHHRPELMQKWNFNVTVPLWDWVKGTIYRGP